jgi:YVTN family beta-propeller protein
VDLRRGLVENVAATGPNVRTVRFHGGGRRVIAGNWGNRTLTIYDVAARRVVTHLTIAVEPWNCCYKATDEGEMYVTGPGMDVVVVVYPFQNEVHETRLIGRSPGEMASSSEYLFVANPESGNITVMNIVTGKVTANVAVGAEPRKIVVTDDGQYALVLNRRSGDMAVIDISAFSTAKGAKTPPPPAALFTMIPVGAKPVSAVIRRS